MKHPSVGPIDELPIRSALGKTTGKTPDGDDVVIHLEQRLS